MTDMRAVSTVWFELCAKQISSFLRMLNCFSTLRFPPSSYSSFKTQDPILKHSRLHRQHQYYNDPPTSRASGAFFNNCFQYMIAKVARLPFEPNQHLFAEEREGLAKKCLKVKQRQIQLTHLHKLSFQDQSELRAINNFGSGNYARRAPI